MVAREAMAHGRPVVGTGVGGLLDVIIPTGTGAVVQPGDPGELRGAIRSMLDNRDLAAELGRNARELARAELSWLPTMGSPSVWFLPP